MFKYTLIVLISLLAGNSLRVEAQIRSEKLIIAQSDKNKKPALYNFRDTASFDPLPPEFVPHAQRERLSKQRFVNSSSYPDFRPWLADGTAIIRRAWAKDFVGRQIECVCTVVKDGSVFRSRITKSSGDNQLDKQVTQLIKTIEFRPLPAQMAERDFIIRFQDYTKIEMSPLPSEQPTKGEQKLKSTI